MTFVCGFVEDYDLWHPEAGSAVVADEEVNPAKQEPLERIGESQAVEQSHRVIEFASVATTSEILEAGPERTPSFRLRLLVGTSR